MRWLITGAAAALLLFAVGCDYGMTADEVAAEENALRMNASVTRTAAPATTADEPTAAPGTRRDGATAKPVRVFQLEERGMEEPVPPYYPGVGTPIEDPPGPCPPPMR